MERSARGIWAVKWEGECLGAIGGPAPRERDGPVVAITGMPGGDPAAFRERACGEFEAAGVSIGGDARHFPGVAATARRGGDKQEAGQDGDVPGDDVWRNQQLFSKVAWLARPGFRRII